MKLRTKQQNIEQKKCVSVTNKAAAYFAELFVKIIDEDRLTKNTNKLKNHAKQSKCNEEKKRTL